MQMRMMALMAVLLAVCLVVLPLLFSNRPFQPTRMEQEQQMQPLQTQEPQQQAKQEEQQEEEQAEKAADWEPFLILNRTTGEIEEVPVEEYVVGALCSEMPATFHTEALKAQAVSAHTWALYCQRQARESSQPYDFSADPLNWQGYVTEEQARERFGDYFDQYWGRVKNAAQAVWQEIVVDEAGEPIVAAYHAISSGRTESAENVWGNPLSYLVPVDSAGDIHAPGYEESVSFTAEELQPLLQAAEPAPALSDDPSQWLSVLERSGSGYVTLVRVGDRSISGIELRELLGLRSSDFDFALQDGTFTFTTLGYGHGVGLSQYGADYLARQGSDYRAILEHYYTGASVVEREE